MTHPTIYLIAAALASYHHGTPLTYCGSDAYQDVNRFCPPSRYDCPDARQGLCPIVNWAERRDDHV
jgi:hypothetical protein